MWYFGHSLYRKEQVLGSQQEYCNPYSIVREKIHRLMGLYYIPIDDVIHIFQNLKNEASPHLEELLYTLVRKSTATLANKYKTNYVSEECHNHSYRLIGKDYPDFGAFELRP